MSVYLQMHERLTKLHDCCDYDVEGKDACENCFRQELCFALSAVAERLRIMKLSSKEPCSSDSEDFATLASDLDDLFHQLVDL